MRIADHLLALADRTTVLDGIAERAFVDIDSLLRPVYGHHKQGASFGHAKFASRAAAPWPVRHTGHPDVAAAALGRVRLARFRRVAARRGETVPEHWELRSSPPVPILCVQTRPRSGFPRVLGLARYSRTKVTSMLTR